MATPDDREPLRFEQLKQQQWLKSQQEQYRIDQERGMEAIADRLTPRILGEILPVHVFISYVISQEMRWRFAPAVSAEVLHHDVLTWTARYLKFAQETIYERNPEFSDDERQMVDNLLNSFFGSLQNLLERHIDTAEDDSTQ